MNPYTVGVRSHSSGLDKLLLIVIVAFGSIQPTQAAPVDDPASKAVLNAMAKLHLQKEMDVMDRQMWAGNANKLRDIHQLPGAAATRRPECHLISSRFQAFHENFIATGEGKPLYDEVVARSDSSGKMER
jgi:hypothetical protein